ncbi:uncharacterized protein LOC124162846 [Ischnura elegans]|uniref:uncharacterized protein LOC124162846 n=1 Tax=Ischnura elegans TaxID=197161 RepID=UPI001ED88D29|nr:uncharacterized protein LOC124162846 [Ischnura elegans]
MAIILVAFSAMVFALAKADPQVASNYLIQRPLPVSGEAIITSGNILPQSVFNPSGVIPNTNPNANPNPNVFIPNQGTGNNNNNIPDLGNLFNGPISGNPRCRRNEVFLACGPGCTRTCGNYLLQTTCTRQCRPGCFCAGERVRDEFNRGLCVRPSRCSVLRRRPNRRDRSSRSSSSEEHRRRRKGERN